VAFGACVRDHPPPYASAFPDGKSLRVYQDGARTSEGIAAHDPADAEGWHRLAAACDRFSPSLFEIYGSRLPSLTAGCWLASAPRAHGGLGDRYVHSDEAKAMTSAWGMHIDVFGTDRRQQSDRIGARAGPRHQVPRRSGARLPRTGSDARAGGAGADDLEPIAELARRFALSSTVLFLGRHVGYPVALQGRSSSISWRICTPRGVAAGELKHGPIALIDDGLPVIVVMPSPKNATMLHSRLLSNIREIQARGAITIVIAEEHNDTARPTPIT
jgi:hypothetical protein